MSHVKIMYLYTGADKSLARPGREQVTATEYFGVHYILFIIIIGGTLVLFIYIYIQGVTGGKGQTSGGCSLC